MTFWDASAVVPLVVPETQSAVCTARLTEEPAMLVWALTPVEVTSALRRKHREAQLEDTQLQSGMRRLALLRTSWSEIRELELVAARAERLLAVHALRAADALQRGAALIACNDRPSGWSLVCLDTALGVAAGREGFTVLPRAGG